jgi:hypothetical protein
MAGLTAAAWQNRGNRRVPGLEYIVPVGLEKMIPLSKGRSMDRGQND